MLLLPTYLLYEVLTQLCIHSQKELPRYVLHRSCYKKNSALSLTEGLFNPSVFGYGSNVGPLIQRSRLDVVGLTQSVKQELRKTKTEDF